MKRLIFYVWACLWGISTIAYANSELRVVSLAPSLTELVYALGLGSNLVGNTRYCDYPEEAKHVPKIGDFSNPNFEAIVQAKPTVVLSARGNASFVVQKLKNAGIRVLESDPMTLDELKGDILLIGKELGKIKESEELAQNIQKAFDNLKERGKKRAAKKHNKTLLVLSWNPIYSVAKGTWLGHLFDAAGFENIVRDTSNLYPQLNVEFLLKERPEYIFADSMSFSKQTSKEQQEEFYKNVEKIFGKNSKSIQKFILPKDIFMRPGPRVIDAMNFLAKIE